MLSRSSRPHHPAVTAAWRCPAALTARRMCHRAPPRSSTVARAAASSTAQQIAVSNPEGGTPFLLSVQVPAGAQPYQVTLKKPLGLTLTEASSSGIVVDEVQAGGSADKAGVTKGDVLLAVTARSQEPGSSSPRLVLLPTQGQSFKTVAAGLRSNTCAQCSIVLVLQRAAGGSASGGSDGS